MPASSEPMTAPRHPACERMQEIFLAEIEYWTGQFGRHPLRPVKDWVRAGGYWRLSCVWFVTKSAGPENHGFRINYNGEESFTVEIWAPRTRCDMNLSSGWNAQRLRQALTWAFSESAAAALASFYTPPFFAEVAADRPLPDYPVTVKDGTMMIEGLPFCTITSVQIWDSSDPRKRVGLPFEVGKVMTEGNTLSVRNPATATMTE